MKPGYFTRQEVMSQPQTWERTLRIVTKRREGLQDFLAEASFKEVLTVGCGSTHYLAQSAATLLCHGTDSLAQAFPSSELWLFAHTIRSDAMLLTISRSGRTTETIRALERFRDDGGGPVLAVTCYPDSPLARQADFVLVAPDGQEQSVAQTRSFTSMLLLVQALTAVLADDDEMFERLYSLPECLSNLMDRAGDMAEELGKDLTVEQFFFVGAGPLYGLANESMLKTKEMSLSRAEAYHPMEFRHGPMSMVDEHTLMIGLISDTGLTEEISVLRDMQELGARTMAIIEDASVLAEWQPDNIIELRSGLDEWQRGPLYLPAIQQLAYYRALTRGLDPDQPSNLTAVVEL